MARRINHGGDSDSDDESGLLPSVAAQSDSKYERRHHRSVLAQRSLGFRRLRTCFRHPTTRLFVAGTLAVLMAFALIEAAGRLRCSMKASSNAHVKMGFYKENPTYLVNHPPQEARLRAIPDLDLVHQWVTKRARSTTGKRFLVGCSSRWGKYVLRAFKYMFQELQDEFNWLEVDTSINEDALRAVFFSGSVGVGSSGTPPAAVLFCLNSFESPMLLFHEYAAMFDEMRAKGTILAIWNDDLHYYDQFTPLYLRESIFKRVDVLLSTYVYLMDEYFASVTSRMDQQDLPITVWLPHSSNPDFTSAPFNEFPIDKIFLSGAHGANWYPLRHWLWEEQENHQAFMDIYKHPGYGVVADNQSAVYASYMRSYRVGMTTTMLLQYVVAKVFEIPSTGSLLLVNRELSTVLQALGYIEDQHYVGYPASDPWSGIWHVLVPENRAKIDRIRANGMHLVRQFHMVSNRTAAFANFFANGQITYYFPSDIHVGDPCPMISYPSEAKCHTKFISYGLYKCDMWFCGVKSLFN